jgi:hypothetical protein
MDLDTQLLGNKEWENRLILGGCLATGTQNGKTRPGGTPIGDNGVSQNPILPLLETRNRPQQMENMEHSHPIDKRPDRNSS